MSSQRGAAVSASWRTGAQLGNETAGNTPFRPVWVKGNNYGNTAKGQHYCWAYWDGEEWREARCDDAGNTPILKYLTHWMIT